MKDGLLKVVNNTFTANTAVEVSCVVTDGSSSNDIADLTGNLYIQSGGAMFFDSVKDVSISGSVFADNTAGFKSDSGGGGGAITLFLGKISLTNTVFIGNGGPTGFDILVEDDTDPSTIGSFITCNARVSFCNGLDGYDELSYEDNVFTNSNCLATGIAGQIGEGQC